MNCVEFKSFVRGYHAYTSVWTPVVDEILELIREPNNVKDNQAVAVVKDSVVVGHLPKRLAPTVFLFLSRDCNSGDVQITGNILHVSLANLQTTKFLLPTNSE